MSITETTIISSSRQTITNNGIRRLCLKYCAPSSLPRMGVYILTALDKEIK
jgi:hypothetical protein